MDDFTKNFYKVIGYETQNRDEFITVEVDAQAVMIKFSSHKGITDYVQGASFRDFLKRHEFDYITTSNRNFVVTDKKFLALAPIMFP